MKKPNLFDYAFLSILLILIATFFFFSLNKNDYLTDKVQLKIKITLNYNSISGTAATGETYLDSINVPVKISAVEKGSDNGVDYFLVTLQGNGKIEKDQTIFEGLRVWVGQKAELHGSFWAQGTITEIAYAN